MSIMTTSGMRGLAVLMLALGLGCRRPSTPQASTLPAADAGAAGAVDAGQPSIDSGPRPIPGARATALTDGGLPLGERDGGAPDAGDEQSSELDLATPDASVPDWARLTFMATVPLDDFRARVLGSDGQLVANHAEAWVTDGGTQVRFLPAPLWPSHGCCRLMVDGQTEKLPAGGGSHFLPFEVDFAVAADPEHPRPVRAAKRHHRHRRQ